MSQIPHPKQPIELNAASVLGQDAGTVASPLVVKIGGALLENAAQHLDAFAALIALPRACGWHRVGARRRRAGRSTTQVDGHRNSAH